MPRPKQPVTFFIDRCLGEGVVAETLRRAGALVEIHGQHFPGDCPDAEWIPAVAAWGWAILSKDKAIRRTELELTALRTAGAAAFFLASGQMDGASMAEAFRLALPTMERLFWSRTRPLIARVTKTGHVTVQEGDRAGGIRR